MKDVEGKSDKVVSSFPFTHYGIRSSQKKLSICLCSKLSKNVFTLKSDDRCMCTAEDRRYGIRYRCMKLASVASSCIVNDKLLQPSYCSANSLRNATEASIMLRLSCILYRGNLVRRIYLKGELKVCCSTNEQHIMHADCHYYLNQTCCHCNAYKTATTCVIYSPYKNVLFEKLDAIYPLMIQGIQLNLCKFFFFFLDVPLHGEYLLLAVEADNAFSVRILLHHGAPIIFQSKSDEIVDVFSVAVTKGSYNAAEEILKYVNYSCTQMQRFINGRLLEFIDNISYQVLDVLLAYGTNIYERNKKGETIFHKLADHRDEKYAVTVASKLFENREVVSSFINAGDNLNRTALQIACENSRWELVIDINLAEKPYFYKTCMYAIFTKMYRILHTFSLPLHSYMNRFLVKHGAKPRGLSVSVQLPEFISLCMQRLERSMEIKNSLLLSSKYFGNIDIILHSHSNVILGLFQNQLIFDSCNYKDITMGHECVVIPLENGTNDGATLSPDFEYLSVITDVNFFRTHVDFSLVCHCTNDCKEDCPCNSRCVYDSNGRLTDETIDLAIKGALGTVLECSTCCFCSINCRSRVAQKRIRCRLQIYRSIKYGWAVRAVSFIHKGSFICEYTGELISTSEADDRTDDDYLFETVDSLSTRCIDAKFKGSVSRFINHSCDANVVVLRVVWDAHTCHLPHICFYAKRDVQEGEELTIDYGSQWWKVKLKKFACKCESENCNYTDAIREKFLESQENEKSSSSVEQKKMSS
ncbi:unnamed protein product [Thelazia callipaeda]|uniref:SET domain-containing protein n=1 Tax=Thelazia callipaeda TaxID=103827 RepID=A0A0N5DBP2_THECL|nr:unnamed protein product [Thelazia callipaeda]